MPKVFFSENQRLCNRLASWVYGEMKSQGIKQQEMAEAMGISQQAFSMKLKKHNFTFADFLVIVRVLNPDEKEITRLLGRS